MPKPCLLRWQILIECRILILGTVEKQKIAESQKSAPFKPLLKIIVLKIAQIF